MATFEGRFKVNNITATFVAMAAVTGSDTKDYGSKVTAFRLTFGAGDALLLDEFQLNREFNVVVERM